MTGRGLIIVALFGALLGWWIAPGRGYTTPTDTGPAYVSKVDPAPAGDKITATLSTGVEDVIGPCEFEDSRDCYWQADLRGNKRGASFINLGGEPYPVDLDGFRPEK